MPAPTVFLGLPDYRPEYIRAARDLGAPVMLSASAFARRWTKEMHDRDESHPGFRPPPAGRLDGMRVALDSMGFTATTLYGGYPVSEAQYFELARAFPWGMWSSQDLCCEPQVASDEKEIMARCMETGHRYDRLAAMADAHGIARPMKVLQGWAWWHYLVSAEALEVSEGDGLVGIGSVCKRQRGGPDGMLAILDMLDRELPRGVRFHLFGVTSNVLEEVASHPRVASMDSQAWGAALRRDHQTGRNNALVVQYMAKFYRAQMEHVRRGGRGFPPSMALPLRPPPAWKGRSLAYRRAAAEVLHAIRNGDLSAADYAHSMRLFAWAEQDGAIPARWQEAA